MKRKFIFIFFTIIVLLTTSCNKKALISDELINNELTINASSIGDMPLSYSYSDKYFDQNKNEYSLDLARLSMMFSYSAGNAKGKEEDKPNIVKEFFNQNGFTNFKANQDYMEDETDDSVGIAIGAKELADGSVLIGTTIRGISYNNEWAYNFKIGESGIHSGFKEKRDVTLDFIEDFINEYYQNRNIRLWFSGYSKAGSIMNIVSAYFNQYAYYKDNNKYYNDFKLDYDIDIKANILSNYIYSYTFEAPNVIPLSYKEALDDINNNIFNISLENDLIPYLPPNTYDFYRYGIDVVIKTEDNLENLKAKLLEIGSKMELKEREIETKTLIDGLYTLIVGAGYDRIKFSQYLEDSIGYFVDLYYNDKEFTNKLFNTLNLINLFNIAAGVTSLKDLFLPIYDENNVPYDDTIINYLNNLDEFIAKLSEQEQLLTVIIQFSNNGANSINYHMPEVVYCSLYI